MTATQLDTVFFALADPTRRAILARLATGEASVRELAEPFSMSARAVSKHLRVLENAGLIASGRDAQRRPRQLVPNGLKDAAAWFEQYRLFWETSLDRLEQYVAKVQKAKSRPKSPRRQKARLDGN
jgi:DNA-binding transcriptional ArsR family regulator